MEDSSSDDDDFMNLPGPSTRGRQKRKCGSGDASGSSTKKVGGGSGRDELKPMTKEEKKREAARIRKAQSRAKKNEAEKEEERKKAQVGMKQLRIQHSEVQREEERVSAQIRMAQSRANKDEAEKEEERKKARVGMAKHRENMTREERAAAREQNRQEVATHRANMTEERRQEVRRSDRLRKMQTRADMAEDERAEAREQERIRLAIHRQVLDSKVTLKDGLRTSEILKGEFHVPLLENSKDSIGRMNVLCQHCGAFKFAKETPGSCCSNGKVDLKPFPRPPPELMNLWTGNGRNARIFRQFARELNNASSLSSIKVIEKKFNGFSPSVIFQGQLIHRTGGILPADGEVPVFSQLYCVDPALENAQRVDNMYLPDYVTSAQKDVLKEVLRIVQKSLHEHNPYVKDFKMIAEIPPEELGEGKIVISASKKPVTEHPRRYNAQANLNEVSILTNEVGKHDLVLQQRGGGLRQIHDLNPKGMPLRFTVLFPYGTYGWDPSEKHTDSERRVTTREFLAFHIQIRGNENENFLHMAGRLFQEWLCMGWVSIENQRLGYHALNQKALRADTYKNVKEATEERIREAGPRADNLFNDDHQQVAIGRKILASSFSGGPRWYNAKFQDAMAICREYRKPDLFITMTCNPNWTEIQSELKNGQPPQNRADLVARVFKLKRDQLMKDLNVGQLFGKTVAHMNVIEFQKRGLPHCHILIILADHDRDMSPEFVDSIVTAELPPSPDDTDDPTEKEQRQRLQDIVMNSMVHGPCGASDPSKPCMEDGQCTKRFPKEFQKATIVDHDNNYATYKRRSPEQGGQVVKNKNGREVDNSWIVPYNAYLSLRYNCHINVECCVSTAAVKYLCKYVNKGNDRAMVATSVEGQRDEIAEYRDMRSVGSSEAAWHILSYPIADRYPAVLAMRVHLEDQQDIVFDEDADEFVEALEKQRETELTAFFKFNENARAEGIPSEDLPTYVEMPKKNRYDRSKKQWVKRKRGSDTTIGRVHTINPVAGETYFLRMLLHDDHCRGKTSFQDMLTLPGRDCETYKEVCCELGLLNDDQEWRRVLEEAAATQMCKQIRELFVIILLFCLPSDPAALFSEFWNTWFDDIQRNHERQGITLTEQQLKTMVLLDLETRLASHEKRLQDFGLPVPTEVELADVERFTSTEPAVIREELDFNYQDLRAYVEEKVPTFTPEQNSVFETIMNAVRNDQPLQAFIDARGGCGKTYVLNTILAAVRSLKPGQPSVALAMATTGIAANLLTLGRTFHSRMKAPLTPTETSTLAITAQSDLAKLVKRSKLFLIDEATMLNGYQLEALDRTLRDLMNKPDKPFGDKIIILAGDFRQCLPVISGATRAGIVQRCVNQSFLWNGFQILKLSTNMRVHASGDAQLEAFDKWTLDIGNGQSEAVKIPWNMIATQIVPNSKENSTLEGKSMEEFCNKIFPNLAENKDDSDWLYGRAILATTNKEVAILNDIISSKLPGTASVFRSADELLNRQDLLRFNAEYLNSLTPNGFPPHALILKPGMLLMLLRNLNPREGLCNGTKLEYVTSYDNKVLQCKVSGTDRTVLIPRIVMFPKIGEYPFEWARRQFPVKPAFAMTVNKSQGK